jgi:flagellar assembly protein FliH
MRSLNSQIIRKEEVEQSSGLRGFEIEQFCDSYREKTCRQIAQQDAFAAATDEDVALARRETGYKEGMRQGIDEGRKQLADVVALCQRLAAELRQARETTLKHAEEDLLALSLAIARKVIAAHVAIEPDTVRPVIKAALDQLVDKESIVIRVNPLDVQRLTESGVQVTGLLNKAARVEIVGDESVTRGGCILDAQSGGVDADLRTQLDEIARHLGVDQSG